LEAANQLTAGTGVEVQVGVSGTPRPLANRVENTLLRIGQEALTNAMKHAKPRKIAVELCYDSHAVRLRIADDGEGFDTDTVATASDGHFGLTGMRERLERLRGELDLQSGNGKGTQVVATIPT
jgi:signal transduction histidine kinase